MADREREREDKKPLKERAKELIQGVVGALESVFPQPQLMPIPVPARPRPRRR